MNKMCSGVGCKAIVKTGKCDKCKGKVQQANKKRYTIRNKNNAKRDSFYQTAAWKRLRDRKVRQDPLCEHCLANGYNVPAKDIDHIIEVKDDDTKKLDITNLKSLCRSCHMIKSASERKKRKANEVNETSESKPLKGLYSG